MDLEYFVNYVKRGNYRPTGYAWRLPSGDVPFPIPNLPVLRGLSEAGEGEYYELPSYTIGPPPPSQSRAPRAQRASSSQPPHVHQFHTSDDQPSTSHGLRRTKNERYLSRSLTQYAHHHDLVQRGVISRSGPHPDFYTDPYAPNGGYPGTLFENAGITQDEWCRRFGGLWTRDESGPSDGQGNVGGSQYNDRMEEDNDDEGVGDGDDDDDDDGPAYDDDEDDGDGDDDDDDEEDDDSDDDE